MRYKVFISSVQKEFAEERRMLSNYLRKDALFGRFFDVFVFEDIPAKDQTPEKVNAIAHRDYDSTASVQVMLFSDRLEISNPGQLPTQLTIDKLKEDHASYPRNPLLAEVLYLAHYIERMGTGIQDITRRCREYGLPEPEFKMRDGFVVIIYREKGLALEK
jgi:hypothetical protein